MGEIEKMRVHVWEKDDPKRGYQPQDTGVGCI